MMGPLKFDGRFDKAVEQGMRFRRARLELRVGLRPDIERMDILRQLNEFGKLTVRACAAYLQACIFKLRDEMRAMAEGLSRLSKFMPRPSEAVDDEQNDK